MSATNTGSTAIPTVRDLSCALSLTDLVLRPPPQSGLDKAEANERLAELTDALFELTK
jgi:hypothetical protein